MNCWAAIRVFTRQLSARAVHPVRETLPIRRPEPSWFARIVGTDAQGDRIVMALVKLGFFLTGPRDRTSISRRSVADNFSSNMFIEQGSV